MWAGSLSFLLLLLLQGAITLVDSATVMSVGLGAEWMKIAVVTVSTMGTAGKIRGKDSIDLQRHDRVSELHLLLILSYLVLVNIMVLHADHTKIYFWKRC